MTQIGIAQAFSKWRAHKWIQRPGFCHGQKDLAPGAFSHPGVSQTFKWGWKNAVPSQIIFLSRPQSRVVAGPGVANLLHTQKSSNSTQGTYCANLDHAHLDGFTVCIPQLLWKGFHVSVSLLPDNSLPSSCSGWVSKLHLRSSTPSAESAASWSMWGYVQGQKLQVPHWAHPHSGHDPQGMTCSCPVDLAFGTLGEVDSSLCSPGRTKCNARQASGRTQQSLSELEYSFQHPSLTGWVRTAAWAWFFSGTEKFCPYLSSFLFVFDLFFTLPENGT